VEPNQEQSGRRWLYAKRFDFETGDIWALYRTRDSELQVLQQGKWRDITGNATVDLEGDPDHEWLRPTERRNLLAYLRTGQTDIPSRLDLEPAERYRKWKCPHCATFTVVPVIVGMPTPEVWEAAQEGHFIVQGCIVYGDEPDYAVACTTCDWFGELIRDRTIRQVARPRAFIDDHDLAEADE